MIGGASAILFQLGFTLAVSRLIQIPEIRLMGASLLAWIACNLPREESRDATGLDAPASFDRAIAGIAAANLVMSLDNALARVAFAGAGLLAHTAAGMTCGTSRRARAGA